MIPRSVFIGGREIVIKVVENSDDLHVDDCSSNWGMSKCDMSMIFLKRLQDESQMEQVLCHEIKHFLDYDTARKEYLRSIPGLDYELQNSMTDNIFWQFLKNNTSFFNERKEL